MLSRREAVVLAVAAMRHQRRSDGLARTLTFQQLHPGTGDSRLWAGGGDSRRQGGVEIVQELVRALADEPLVAYAYVHGSFLDEPAFHDIDVAVSLAAGATSGAHRLVELSESLSANAGMPVDVRALDEAPLAFRFHALRGRLLLSRDDERLAQTIEETTRSYLDIEPILRVATREAFAS